MKPVLITGGAGYIGSHTVLELTKYGVPVVVLDNFITGHRGAVRGGELHEGDIGDVPLVQYLIKKYDINALIHFAARSQVGESLNKPELYFDENTIKSFVFLQAAMKAGVKYFVFSSTAAVYGIPESIPIREDACLSPINPYGASKRMIEEYLQWMGTVHGIKWAALRYFNAAGASLDGEIGEDHYPETHLIPLILQTIQGRREKLSVLGTDYSTPDGTCIRDYVHVLDLASAHILALQLLEQGMPNQALNVGTGQGYSVLQMIERAQSITGREIPLTFESRRPGDPPTLVADSKALINLGWRPQYSSLETILSTAWLWHSTHPEGYRSPCS